MRTLRTVQTSFTAGELDPRLDARVEVTRYYSGAAALRNVAVLPQGGVRRRPGTRHLADLPAAAANGLRLVPFAFSASQVYLLAFWAFGFHVYRGSDGAFLFSGSWPGDAAVANTINFAQSADTLLLFHHNIPPHAIRRAGSDTSWTSASASLANIPNFDFGAGPEPVISASRGWPECGTFHQGRLWLAGLASRPTTLLASRAGQFFDFQQGAADDEGMMLSIDSDQLNQIHQLMSHRGLLIFTSGAEHAITVAPPITPTNVAIEEQSRRGVRRFCRVAEVDGALLFAQRGGAALRQFVYAEIEQAWQAELLSLLSPHLIDNPRDVIAVKGRAQDDGDLVLLPELSGAGMAVLSLLRAQEVVAFTRWNFDGVLLGATALANGAIFLAVARDEAVRLLMVEPEGLLDHARHYAFASPTSTLTGLSHLNGREVVMVLDGRPEGTAVVSGGTLSLPRPCLTAEIGLGFEVLIRTMPVEPRDPTGALIGRKSRLVRMALRLHRSGPVELRGATLATRVIGDDPAPPLDAIPPPAPQRVTGEFILDGLLGWRRVHQVELRQPPHRPAPLTVQALAMTVAVGE